LELILPVKLWKIVPIKAPITSGRPEKADFMPEKGLYLKDLKKFTNF